MRWNLNLLQRYKEIIKYDNYKGKKLEYLAFFVFSPFIKQRAAIN